MTSALPRAGVVRVGVLTEGASGKFDTALVELDDARRVVARVPNDDAAAGELTAELRALHVLTAGVRKLLPFHAPVVLGEATMASDRVVVFDHLDGYRLDAAHVPPGRGAATSLGAALAAVHALPTSIVRAEGLPVRTPQQVRTDVARLLDRAESTRRVPDALAHRWRRAVATDELWSFESAVVLGGIGTAAFVFQDVDEVPEVTGLLEWNGLSVGDPAIDLQWLATAPVAADDVFDAYVAHRDRAPDAHLRDRSRLYAELEFAKWLVHGSDTGDADVMDDAAALLSSLADSTAGDPLISDSTTDLEDAIASVGRVPERSAEIDTSMHTDAYDPDELAQWMAEEDDADDADRTDRTVDGDPAPRAFGVAADAPAAAASAPVASVPATVAPVPDQTETAPLDFGDLSFSDDPAAVPPTVRPIDAGDVPESEHTDHAAEAERASDAALRRWLAD